MLRDFLYWYFHSMRSLRWLLLVAMVLIAAAVAGIYHAQRLKQRSQRRPTPAVHPARHENHGARLRMGSKRQRLARR